MTLSSRKLVVVSIVGLILLAANILVIASWMQDQGVVEFAQSIRGEFLTGTAITILIALLILLVAPKSHGLSIGRKCPVCDHGARRDSKYCGECGSRL